VLPELTSAVIDPPNLGSKRVKIYIVTQHYPPDSTSTAAYMAELAAALAAVGDVIVISGTPGATRVTGAGPPVVVVPHSTPPKHSLVRRLVAMASFGISIFFALLRRLRRNDVVVVVTTPFLLPYFSALAARFRKSLCILIVYDVYPETLTRTMIIRENSFAALTIRAMNKLLFRSLDAIVTIGRDMTTLIAAYSEVNRDKITFIPNWPTLPEALRPHDPQNVFRPRGRDDLVVGLTGNLGFTHDPRTVFEAAHLLRAHRHIHFMISGWGVGWNQLRQWQHESLLPNISLIEPVADSELEGFLAAADAWIIPYLPNLSGVSVPSRLYNLLAVGRPVIGLAELDSELSMVIAEGDVGWSAPPGNPAALANLLLEIARDMPTIEQKGRRAVRLAVEHYSRERAINAYQTLVRELSRSLH
jgi:colanic acid biosynthesis glycosyl transferase WcaI